MTDTHETIEKADALAAKAVLHPAVERVLQNNPTPETLREILALQRDWEAGEAKRAYTRALVQLRQDLPAVIKRDMTVDYSGAKGRVRYTHTSLAAAMEAVLPALTAHGFSLAWTPGTTDRSVSVTATLTHRDGHSESATLSAPADTSGNKSPAQAVASSVTLLQRYTALSILGIATADMKDPESGDEPKADPGEMVDTQRNMRAVAAITKAGKTKKEAEKLVDRPVQKWTTSDLDKLREWLKPKSANADRRVLGELSADQSEFVFDFKDHHNLKDEEMLELIDTTFEDENIKSLQKLTRKQYGILKIKFDKVKLGEAKIVRDAGPIRFEDAEPDYPF